MKIHTLLDRTIFEHKEKISFNESTMNKHIKLLTDILNKPDLKLDINILYILLKCHENILILKKELKHYEAIKEESNSPLN